MTSYTIGRRHISAFEQHVHGFMDVLRSLPCACFFVLAGVPIAEEWLRTHRAHGEERPQAGTEYRPIVAKR